MRSRNSRGSDKRADLGLGISSISCDSFSLLEAKQVCGYERKENFGGRSI